VELYIGLITSILAVIVSCFGLWSALHRFTLDRAHRDGFVHFEAALTRGRI
jgi:fumarate reductase subunit D